MNFFPNFPYENNMMIPHSGMGMNNDMNYNGLFNRFNEIENRIKKLEQRIIRLENESGNNDYNEPDNSLYMI